VLCAGTTHCDGERATRHSYAFCGARAGDRNTIVRDSDNATNEHSKTERNAYAKRDAQPIAHTVTDASLAADQDNPGYLQGEQPGRWRLSVRRLLGKPID